jgi:hypothetical protein
MSRGNNRREERSLPMVEMTRGRVVIPIRLLIKKRAVVFIGEARENQLPISFS